jgi:hypothetical protein
MEWGTDMAEVSGVQDDLQSGISSREFSQNLLSPIRGSIVDDDLLVVILWQGLHDPGNAGHKLLDIPGLVITTGNDTELLHGVLTGRLS